MTDLEGTSGPISSSGGAPGAAPAVGDGGGRASGSRRPSDGVSGIGRSGAGDEDRDYVVTESDSDEGDDADYDDDDLGDEEGGDEDDVQSLRQELEQLRREKAQAEERIKRQQGPQQQAQERAQRAEETIYREAWQQAVAKRSPQFRQEDHEFSRAMAQAEYALQMAAGQGDQQRVYKIQSAMQEAQGRFDAERKSALRDVQQDARDAFLNAKAERFLPYQRRETLDNVKTYYQDKHGYKVPDTVLKHASTEREAWIAAYTWADGQRARKDERRTQRLEQGASNEEQAPKARSSGNNNASARARLKELEGSGNLLEAYELKSRLGIVKTQRVRTGG